MLFCFLRQPPWRGLRATEDSLRVSAMDLLGYGQSCTSLTCEFRVHFNLKFYMMNNPFLDLDFTPDFSYLRSLEENCSSTTDNACSFPNGSVHSVQILETTSSAGTQVKGQNPTGCTLDSFSISHWPAIDNFACENSTLLNAQQAAQVPLYPIKVVEPLIHCQQQAITESVRLKATDPVLLKIKEELVSGIDMLSQNKKTESHNSKTMLSKYIASGKVQVVKSKNMKGKARGRTRYSLSPRSKALKSISNARSNAYRKAKKDGFREEVARAIGDWAAIHKREEFSSIL